jgi:antitoxin VapB
MSVEVINIKTIEGRQEISLPLDMHINDSKVYIKKVGETLYVIPFHNPWQSLIDGANAFTQDFMDKRIQPNTDLRDTLD